MKKGDEVQSGEQLNEGSVYPHDLLAYAGKGEADRRTATELCLIREVQKVYKSQGVDINDKHIEIIVRQMMKRCRSSRRATRPTCPASTSTATRC